MLISIGIVDTVFQKYVVWLWVEWILTSGGRYYDWALLKYNNSCVNFHMLSHTVSHLKHPNTTGKQITTLLTSLKLCYSINKPAAVCVSDSCCDSPDTVQSSRVLLGKKQAGPVRLATLCKVHICVVVLDPGVVFLPRRNKCSASHSHDAFFHCCQKHV